MSPLWVSSSPERLLSKRLWQLAKSRTSWRGRAQWYRGQGQRDWPLTTEHSFIHSFLPFLNLNFLMPNNFWICKAFVFHPFFCLVFISQASILPPSGLFFSPRMTKNIPLTQVKLTNQTHSPPNTSPILAIFLSYLVAGQGKQKKQNCRLQVLFDWN